MSDSFLSIVAHGSDQDVLVVRARHEGDIERAFPDVKAIVDKDADYLYHAEIPRARVAERLADFVSAISYPNFKNTVVDPDRHDAYMDIWSTMYKMQVRARTGW
jgi:hypothetical protein